MSLDDLLVPLEVPEPWEVSMADRSFSWIEPEFDDDAWPQPKKIDRDRDHAPRPSPSPIWPD